MTPECQRLGLDADPIGSPESVELLRQIRNACKDGFSYDNAEISEQAQRAWWVVNRGKVKGWLYWRGMDLVGYGLLRQTGDGRWWSSIAVLPAQVGHGYGGAITADTVRRVDVTVWGAARLDNPAALKLHRSADWVEYDRDERLAHFRTLAHVYGPTDPVLVERVAR